MAEGMEYGRRLGPGRERPEYALNGVPVQFEASEEAETPVLKSYLAILRRQLWLVLGVALVVFSAAAYLVQRERPVYRAGAVVRMVDTRMQMAGGIAGGAIEAAGPMGWAVNPILSESQILRSQALSREVIDSEGLRLWTPTRDFMPSLLSGVEVDAQAEPDSILLQFDAAGVRASWGGTSIEAPYGEPVALPGVRFSVASAPGVEQALILVLPYEVAVAQLQANLAFGIRDRTSFIDLAYTDPDPVRAQRVVNAVAETFQNMNTRSAQQQSRRRRVFIEEQLLLSEAQLAGLHRQLSDFRSREGVYSAAARMAAEQEGLMDLEMRREELAANQRMYQALLQGLRASTAGVRQGLRALVSSPEIAANAVVAQLYGQLVEYEAQRNALTSGPLPRAETDTEVQRLARLIETTETSLVEAVSSHIEATDARLAALNELWLRRTTEMQALPGTDSEEMWLDQQVQGLQLLVNDLRLEHQKAKMAESVEVGTVEVVDFATGPGWPAGTGRFRKLVFGLVAGLALGAAFGILLERMNTSIRRREDIEELLRVPGLAVIPQIAPRSFGRGLRPAAGAAQSRRGRNGSALVQTAGTPGGERLDASLVASLNARSTGAEAYRTLRTNLIFSQAVQAFRAVVVTSASPGEGKTTTAANLAITFAQQGMRVLLLECDLRRGRVHELFGHPREPGLTQVLLGMERMEEVIRSTAVDGLFVLTSGTLPPNPLELVSGERMRALLGELSEAFDFVVIDSPPLLAAADAAVLGTMTDGVLMVLRAGSTERSSAQLAIRQLSGVGAKIIGAVLNDADARARQYAPYDYPQEYYGVVEKV